MDTIVRGTTPSLIIDFSGITDFAVSEITEVALTVKQRTRTDTYGLSDLVADESTLTYHWTQEQTLAMKSGERILLTCTYWQTEKDTKSGVSRSR